MSSFASYALNDDRGYIIQDIGDGRGRGTFLRCDAHGGHITVIEEPAVLWLIDRFEKKCCAYCMKYSGDENDEAAAKGMSHCACETCNRTVYCSSNCRELDAPDHSFLCTLLSNGSVQDLNEDENSMLSLCTRILILERRSKQEILAKVLDLDNSSANLDEIEEKTCEKVFNILNEHGFETTLEFIHNIVRIDKSCGLAVMLPPGVRGDHADGDRDGGDSDGDSDGDGDGDGDNSDEDFEATEDDDDCDAEYEDIDSDEEEEGDGMIRGYGIYPALGYTNHSCMPNCIRWDYVDAKDASLQPTARRQMCFRALFDLAAGTEITQSYVPIGWSLQERQGYLLDMFGFTCACPRCQVEKADAAARKQRRKKGGIKGGSKTKSSRNGPEDNISVDGVDMNYINVYLCKYLCPKDPCTGTLTPLCAGMEGYVNDSCGGGSSGEELYMCNVCGHVRSNEEFMALLMSGGGRGR